MNRNNLKLVGLLYLLAFNFSGAFSKIVVNELMPCNLSTNRSDDTNYHGWVELYNDGDDPVDLKGYVFKNLKKGGTEKWSWTISESVTIKGDNFIMFYFDGKRDKDRYVPYKIDTDGGTIQLLSGGKVVSSVKYGAMVPHISYGVDEDGNLGYMKPTPKKDNSKAYTSLGSRCSKPTFGSQPGICNGPVSLTLSSATADAKIYYTLDGSEPSSGNEKASKYEGPVELKKNDDGRSVVVRARAEKSGALPSAIATASYIFMDSKHESCNGFTVPIVSLTMDPEDYKGNKYGITVKGENGTMLPGKESCISEPANFNQDWDRPANFEYFVDGKAVVSQEVEVAVIGGCSRKDAVKSFKVNSSKKAGAATLKYPFFSANNATEYKSLHIRNGGNTYGGFVIRDAMLQSIAKSMGLDCQDYQAVAYYINGSYKGMMGLRTRANKDLIYAKYGIESEDLDVIEVAQTGVTAATGTMDAYDELIEALQNKDKESPTFLDEIGEMMDIDYYIDYQIFEQFVVNTDWPGNNTKLWRERQNGRFRWIVYDVDFGFGLYHDGGNLTFVDHDMIRFCMGENTHNWANEKSFATVIFKTLMQNKDFQNRFLTRYLYHLDHTFKLENIESLWAPLEKMCKNEFCASPIAEGWDGGWSSMKEFARNRPEHVYNHLKSFFKGGEKVDLRIKIKDESGNVIPNASIILNNVATGKSEYETHYFTARSLTVEPKVPAGYTFKEWTTSSDVATKVVTTPILAEDAVWSYCFKDTAPTGDWKAAAYDASSWMTGKGQFGLNWREDYGTPDVKLKDGDTVSYVTSYYRTKFNVSDPSAIDSMLLEIMYDDGAIIYLNGKELKRYNLPSGTVKYSTYADPYTEKYEISHFFVSKSSLVKGENVIAVEVHQFEGSSDMAFSLSLSQIVSKESSGGSEIFEGSLTKDTELTAIYAKDANVADPMLRLNEICASNNSESGNADEFGNYPDWIEIYNYGKTDIDLAGFYLTDNRDKLKKSVFPYGSESTLIKAGEYKIIYADNATWRGPLHADFKIDRLGGFLGLSYGKQDKVVLIDSVNVKPLSVNATYGRQSDSEGWAFFSDDCSDKGGLVTYGKKNGAGCNLDRSGMDNYLVRLPDDVDPQGIELYPNPASDWITVRTTGEFDDAETVSGIHEVSIYNPQGVLVAQVRADGKPECTVAIDRLLPGIYYLKAVSDYSVFSTVFRKQ